MTQSQAVAHSFTLERRIRFSLTRDCISDPVQQWSPHIAAPEKIMNHSKGTSLWEEADFTDENQFTVRLRPDTGLRVCIISSHLP